MWFGILTFIVGVYVGYKYPQQVQQVIESAKKLFGDVKDKMSKKNEPPQA
ncbi:hypothetical protein [Desulfobacca acetoxidans]|uniref:Uncharacterized protein n=1 Tax=Desulfobacca acetoxidans (strain ATCC 700848 / DSM 11109 / ASRB2) TaxID=880072 RepID=F2NJT6_DESAR|nr:hypothetical protein [Desulfobacca acetoxidans]AEB09741.1 hypothetical protein Desac_1903 [Desulfobacca acetoxidans DSM 11109]